MDLEPDDGRVVSEVDADDARLRRFDIDVANYLSNVRGGLVEATGMFYDLEYDEWLAGQFWGNESPPDADRFPGASCISAGSCVSEGGFEPPRPVKVTRPST